jgi:hypothetical protein
MPRLTTARHATMNVDPRFAFANPIAARHNSAEPCTVMDAIS